MSELNIQPGALTGAQAVYVSKTYARLLALLPQVKVNIFANRAITQPVDFGNKSVAMVNVGVTELDEQKQRLQHTNYSDLFQQKRWVKLRKYNKAFALTNTDELSGANYPNTLETPYSKAILAAANRKVNEVGIEALLGTATAGANEAELKEIALPDSQVITWDKSGGEMFADVLAKIAGLYVDNNVITDMEEVPAFTLANKAVIDSLASDPSYRTILEQNEKFAPMFKMQPIGNILPIKYGKIPFKVNSDESKTYRIPVWTKDSLVIAPWKEFRMEITIDSSLQDNPRKMFAETALDAVRADEKSVYVIEYTEPAA